MTQTQGTDVRPSRRTIAKGAAWAVPVVAAGAAAPAMAASPCEPEFNVQPGSLKCCNGNVKNMKLIVQVNDVSGCLSVTDEICVTNVYLLNNQDIGEVVFEDDVSCVTEGGTFTVYLLDTDSCTVNLGIEYTINGGEPLVGELKSENIPSGNTDDACNPS